MDRYVADPKGGVLRMVCSKCTREQIFRAPTKFEAGHMALKAGWFLDGAKPICSKCPSARPGKYDIPRK